MFLVIDFVITSQSGFFVCMFGPPLVLIVSFHKVLGQIILQKKTFSHSTYPHTDNMEIICSCFTGEKERNT